MASLKAVRPDLRHRGHSGQRRYPAPQGRSRASSTPSSSRGQGSCASDWRGGRRRSCRRKCRSRRSARARSASSAGRTTRAVRLRLAPLHDAETATCVAAERGVLIALGGDCRTPLGALAERAGRRDPAARVRRGRRRRGAAATGRAAKHRGRRPRSRRTTSASPSAASSAEGATRVEVRLGASRR